MNPTQKVYQLSPGQDPDQLLPTTDHPLLVHVEAHLSSDPTNPTSLQVSLGGLLYGQATDHTLGAPNEQYGGLVGSGLIGTAQVSLDANHSPHFALDGAALIDLDLDAGFLPPDSNGSFISMPIDLGIHTELRTGWSYNSEAADDPDGDFALGDVSTFQFDDVGIHAGQLLDGFVGSVIGDVQQITDVGPLKEVIAILGTPIPGLSDLGVNVSLADMIPNGNGIGGIIDALNKINNFPSLTSPIGSVDTDTSDLIPIGSFDLVKNGSASLDSLANEFGAGGDAASSLVQQLSGGVDNLQDFVDQADSLLKSDAFDQVTSFDTNSSDQFHFDLPILDDPEGTVLGLLLGRQEPLFDFDASASFNFQLSTDISAGLFSLGLDGKIGFKLNLSMGYDTFGLIEIGQQVANGQTLDAGQVASDALDGFYFDTSTGLSISGEMDLSVGATVVFISGGLGATIDLHLNGGDQGEVRLGDIVRQIANGGLTSIFAASGSIYFEADLSIEIPTPVGSIPLFSTEIARVNLISFGDAASTSNGFLTQARPHVIFLDPSGNGETVHVYHSFVQIPSFENNSTTTDEGIEVDYLDSSEHLTRQEFYEESSDADDQSFNNYLFPYSLIMTDKPAPVGETIIIDGNLAYTAYPDPSNPYNSGDVPFAIPDPEVILVGTAGNPIDPTGGYTHDFEYYGTGTALLIGGGGNNRLIGGTYEFGGWNISPKNAQGNTQIAENVANALIAMSGQGPVIPPNQGVFFNQTVSDELIGEIQASSGDSEVGQAGQDGRNVLLGDLNHFDQIYGGNGTNLFDNVGYYPEDNSFNPADSTGSGYSLSGIPDPPPPPPPPANYQYIFGTPQGDEYGGDGNNTFQVVTDNDGSANFTGLTIFGDPDGTNTLSIAMQPTTLYVSYTTYLEIGLFPPTYEVLPELQIADDSGLTNINAIDINNLSISAVAFAADGTQVPLPGRRDVVLDGIDQQPDLQVAIDLRDQFTYVTDPKTGEQSYQPLTSDRAYADSVTIDGSASQAGYFDAFTASDADLLPYHPVYNSANVNDQVWFGSQSPHVIDGHVVASMNVHIDGLYDKDLLSLDPVGYDDLFTIDSDPRTDYTTDISNPSHLGTEDVSIDAGAVDQAAIAAAGLASMTFDVETGSVTVDSVRFPSKIVFDAAIDFLSLTGPESGAASYTLNAFSPSMLDVSLGTGPNTVTVDQTTASTNISAPFDSSTATTTLDLESTAATGTFTFDGGNGTSLVSIGYFSQSAQDIQGTVDLQSEGIMKLSIDDSADPSPRTVGLDPGGLTGLIEEKLAAYGYHNALNLVNLDSLTLATSPYSTITVNHGYLISTNLETDSGLINLDSLDLGHSLVVHGYGPSSAATDLRIADPIAVLGLLEVSGSTSIDLYGDGGSPVRTYSQDVSFGSALTEGFPGYSPIMGVTASDQGILYAPGVLVNLIGPTEPAGQEIQYFIQDVQSSLLELSPGNGSVTIAASHGTIQITGGTKVTVTDPNQLLGELIVYAAGVGSTTALEIDIPPVSGVDDSLLEAAFSNFPQLLAAARAAAALQVQEGTVFPEQVTLTTNGILSTFVADARPTESDPLLQIAVGAIQPIQVGESGVGVTIDDNTGVPNAFNVNDTPGGGATINTAAGNVNVVSTSGSLQVDSGGSITLGDPIDPITGTFSLGQGTLTALQGSVVLGAYVSSLGTLVNPAVTVNDVADTIPRVVTIGPSSGGIFARHEISGLAPANIIYGSYVELFTLDPYLSGLEIIGGTGASTFNILDLGLQPTILEPGPNASVNVGATTTQLAIEGGRSVSIGLGSVASLRGNIDLFTDGDAMSVNIDDSKDAGAGAAWTISPSGIGTATWAIALVNDIDDPAFRTLTSLNLSVNADSSVDVLGVPAILAPASPGFTPSWTVQGVDHEDTLQGPDQPDTWWIVGPDSGVLNYELTYTGFNNLTGGLDNNTFDIANNGLISGVLDGGDGGNTLDYSGYTGDVTVDLPLGTASRVGGGVKSILDVVGSVGNDILVGNGTGNTLFGGTGRNLLIAGVGPGSLVGGPDDDILVGGSTNYDSNPAALTAIMAEWDRTDLGSPGDPTGYQARVNHLLDGGGLNGTSLLNTSTFHDNGDGNILAGADGLDLFFGRVAFDENDWNPGIGELFVDARAPTSGVSALPSFSPGQFTVRWSGIDVAGPGIIGYSVYVSDDNAAFTPWLIDTTQTSATFIGVNGHTYGFYSVATDAAGTRQATPRSAQASTTVDATPPTSHVSPLPARGTSLSFAVSATGSDPDAADGGPASGVASYIIYALIDGGTWTPWTTVPASNPTATYIGQSNTTYSFYSLATDLVGNIENKSPRIEASTYLPDLTPPVTTVNATTGTNPSTVDRTTGTFTLDLTGSDPGGAALSDFEVFVSIDGGSYQEVGPYAIPAGFADSHGNYHSSITYQGLTDGQSHTYSFYSIGLDSAGNLQGASKSPNVTFADQVFALAQPGQLQVSSFTVEHGSPSRSFIQYLDLGFNESDAQSSSELTNIVNSIGTASPDIVIYKYDLNGDASSKVSVPLTSPTMLSVIDHAIEINFGPGGIGNSPTTTAADGYYEVDIKLPDGQTAVHHFDRLLGDVAGDGIVDQNDLNAIAASINETSELVWSPLSASVTGDGTVSSLDLLLATRSKNRKLGTGLSLG